MSATKKLEEREALAARARAGDREAAFEYCRETEPLSVPELVTELVPPGHVTVALFDTLADAFDAWQAQLVGTG